MTESTNEKQKPTIWIDADACPAAIKDIIFRSAKRLKIQAVLVANADIRIPKSDFIRMIVVPHGADIADNRIVEELAAGDLVVTADIPLASRVVKKGGTAIGPRGQLYDDATVHARLATRDLMEQIRASGIDTGGPKPLDKKHVQAFANLLDKLLTKAVR